MPDRILEDLLKREMTRKQFLTAVALSLGAIFGITGILRQLESIAQTPTAELELEDSTAAGNMMAVNDATASGQKAIKFGSLPTTGNLYTRCAFGVATGSTAAHEALEMKLGAKLKHYVKYYDMGHNGIGNFPSVDAAWCKNPLDTKCTWLGTWVAPP